MSQPEEFDSVSRVAPDGVRTLQADAYRLLLEAAPDAIVVVDLGGRILFANGQTTRIFGYSAPELSGRPIEMLIPARFHEAHRKHREEYSQAPTQRPMGIDMTLIALRKNGTEFPVEVSLSPVQLDSTSVVCVAVRDVSWAQSAREAVTRAHYNAQIAKLGQFMIEARGLDDIASTAPAVTAAALGADACVLYLLNTEGDEIQCRGAFGIPDESLPSLRSEIAPGGGRAFVLAAPDVVIVEDFRSETRYTPGPTIRTMGYRSGIGLAIAGEFGPVGMLLARFREPRKFSEDDKNFMRSATNILGAAIKTVHAEDRLRHSQKLEAVGQLSGGIAHDFNNLLTVIIGNLQMIEEEIAGNETIVQPVEAALRAAGNAADLTRKLLAFSRRQALRPRPIDVNERVAAMLEMIRRTLGERISILAHPDPSAPPALADPSQLETALLNLVVNARDAMPRGGRLTIETGTRVLDAEYAKRAGDLSANRYVMIAVSDNGIGMTAEVAQRAFDPYFTTKEHGKGSGLGLSMVHGFAKQSRGHVAIYSEPGHGTSVRLFLPIASGKAVIDNLAQSRPSPASGDESILMVEDNAQVREVGSRFLTEIGYRVYCAENAEDALELLAAHPDIKLLFTDIVLPGRYGGRELAEVARQRRPDLPLLFTSGFASGTIEGVDQLLGALLDKPYHRDTLAAAVRAALDRP